MEKNLVLAILLSISVIFVWEGVVMRPYRMKYLKNQQTIDSGKAASQIESQSSAQNKTAVTTLQQAPGELFTVKSPNSELVIDSKGAGIKHWYIKENDKFLDLVADNEGAAFPLITLPEVNFTMERLGDTGALFKGTTQNGMLVSKFLQLSTDGYLHTLELTFQNTGQDTALLNSSLDLGPGLGTDVQDKRYDKNATRIQVYNSQILRRLRPGKMFGGDFVWTGIGNTYFLMALVPESSGTRIAKVSALETNNTPVLEIPLNATLAPGETKSYKFRIYAGPKRYPLLKKYGFGLEKSIDYGMFAPLSQAALFILRSFYHLTRNYGWSVVLLTLAIQILTMPLSIKSFKHGLKMKELQPQIKRLQQQFKSDPKRLNMEMLNLYKRHGMKFMGLEGCMPMILQMPIFWALFSVLRNTYELRGAPWIWWVRDLSIHDPYYVLPVLMGIGMLIQQKMSSVAADPNQAMMVYLMPIMFTFFFLKMPAGLVIYWFTNNLVGIGVQFTLLRRAKQ